MISPEENDAFVTKIREALARQNKTRQWLANAARISMSTLEKGLSGKRFFTLSTLVKIEDALEITLRNPPHIKRTKSGESQDEKRHMIGIAPENMGSYSKQQVTPLIQQYLTVRPSFSLKRNCLFTYITELKWDNDIGQLTFEESKRIDDDFTQFGLVAVPHKSGHIYLVTNRHGQHRMVTLSKPTIRDELFGILNSLIVRQAGHMSPISCPIALVPLAHYPEPFLGIIEPHQAIYKDYAALLRKATGDGFCSLLDYS